MPQDFEGWDCNHDCGHYRCGYVAARTDELPLSEPESAHPEGVQRSDV